MGHTVNDEIVTTKCLKPFIDLRKISGISLQLENGTLQSKDFAYRKAKVYTIDDIRNQLLNRELYCPEKFYSRYVMFDHNSVLQMKDIKLNFYVVEGGVAGIEYVKTHAWKLKNNCRIFEVLHGRGMLMILHNEQTYICRLKVGEKMIVPGESVIAFINTRFQPLIIEEIYAYEGKSRRALAEKRGMPYYVISKNSKPAVVQNPNYKGIPKYKKIDWKNVVETYNISLKTPVVKQILRKYEKFAWLFDKNTEIRI